MDFDQIQKEEVNQGENWKASIREAIKSPYKRYVLHFTIYLTIPTLKEFFSQIFFFIKERITYISQ